MDFSRIAARVVEARKRKKPRRVAEPAAPVAAPSPPENVLRPATEYSCRMEISLSADFEGDVSKKDLIKKLKSEVIASIKLGMEQVAKDLRVQGTGIVVKPLQVECAVNDQADMEDELEIVPDAADFAEPDAAPPPKKRKR